jgi:hypothetical protein
MISAEIFSQFPGYISRRKFAPPFEDPGPEEDFGRPEISRLLDLRAAQVVVREVVPALEPVTPESERLGESVKSNVIAVLVPDVAPRLTVVVLRAIDEDPARGVHGFASKKARANPAGVLARSIALVSLVSLGLGITGLRGLPDDRKSPAPTKE